jgi:hypothetical protein
VNYLLAVTELPKDTSRADLTNEKFYKQSVSLTKKCTVLAT